MQYPADATVKAGDTLARIRAIMAHRRFPGECEHQGVALHRKPFSNPSLERLAWLYAIGVRVLGRSFDFVREREDGDYDYG